MEPKKIIVVFDLDGTLVHTAPSLLKAGNSVLTEIGRDKIGVEKYSYKRTFSQFIVKSDLTNHICLIPMSWI